MKHCLDFLREKEVFKSAVVSCSMKSRLFQKKKKIKFSCSGLINPVIKNNMKKIILTPFNKIFNLFSSCFIKW